jgi:hypothetical protein
MDRFASFRSVLFTVVFEISFGTGLNSFFIRHTEEIYEKMKMKRIKRPLLTLKNISMIAGNDDGFKWLGT